MTPEEDLTIVAADRIDYAADKLTDLAAEATPGPWHTYDDNGLVSVESSASHAVCTDAETNGAWIETLSPAVLPPLVAWLRDAAECIRDHFEGNVASDGDRVRLCANEIQAYGFAELVLGDAT